MKSKIVAKKHGLSYTVASKKNMTHIENSPAREGNQIKDVIGRQLNSFLQTREHALLMRERRDEIEVHEDIKFLSKFYLAFLDERIARSEEMSSPEIGSAVRIAVEMMGSRPGVISCMDGRIPLPVIAGLPMIAAKGLRLPGGDTPGFRHNPQDGRLELDPESQLGKMLNPNQDAAERVKFEIFISHSHCAARQRLVSFTGKNPSDKGLYEDTYDKSLQGEVLERDFGIRSINFTYDPETGYGFMGLSKKDVLQDVKKNAGGLYTDGVIEQLVNDGQVISTKELAEELSHLFQNRQFTIDWTGNYKDSALRFWTNMQMMGVDILPQIKERIRTVYPDREDDEIQMRSVFLLANAYSGWLHSPEGQKHPFEKHTEACVVIDYKTKGPFKLSAFIVTPSEGTTPENVLLAETIVRANREQLNIADITDTFDDGRFVEASVPVIYKEEVGVHSSEKHFWDTVRNLDWSDVSLTWETADLEHWLKTQVGQTISYNHLDALMNVVTRMKTTILELRKNPHIQYLLDGGHMTILPLLVSDDRKPQSIAQLVS